MAFREIAVISSLIICVLIVSTSPLRVKKILKKTGEKLVGVKMGNFLMPSLVLVFSFLILLLMKFRELGRAGDLVLCLVAILGSAIGSEEFFLGRHSGLYQNAIIGNGHYLLLSEIFRVPFLCLDREEQEKSEITEFKVITNRKASVTFRFLSAEDCKNVLTGLDKILSASS